MFDGATKRQTYANTGPVIPKSCKQGCITACAVTKWYHHFSYHNRQNCRLLTESSNHAGAIDSHTAFLSAIGRSAETKLNVESWDDLWRMNGGAMRKAGLSVRDRRYVGCHEHELCHRTLTMFHARTGISSGQWKSSGLAKIQRSSRIRLHQRRRYGGEQKECAFPRKLDC